MLRTAILAAGIFAATTTSLLATDMTRVRDGLAVARGVCADCHVIAAHEEAPVVTLAPSFETIANAPGVTELAIGAMLQTSHPNMPNLVLSPEDRASVAAFIVSLRRE